MSGADALSGWLSDPPRGRKVMASGNPISSSRSLKLVPIRLFTAFGLRFEITPEGEVEIESVLEAAVAQVDEAGA
jgi:hypothetical protein